MVVNTVEVASKHAYLVWSRLPGREILEAVGKEAVQLVKQARPWQACRDPLQVFVLTMARVGWSVGSYKDVRDDLGRIWDLEKISPGLVAHLARASALRAIDKAAMMRQQEGQGAWVSCIMWEPIVDFFQRKGLTRQQQAYRSLLGAAIGPSTGST